MPKVKVSNCNKAKVYEKEFPGEFIVNCNQDLFCTICSNVVACEKRFTVERHRATTKHKKYISLLKEEKTDKDEKKLKKQTFFRPVAKKPFTEKVVQTFLAADIPLYKLRNPHLVQLFADLGQSVPSESSCRNYVETLAESETERLCQLFENKNVFIVIDETKLKKVKYVNVVIGDIAVPEKTYLLDCSEIETANQQVIAAKIDDALRKINIPREKFVL